MPRAATRGGGQEVGVARSARRVAIFSALYPPHVGGVESFTLGLARELASRGDEVTVVTNDTEGVGAGLRAEGGVEVVRLPCAPLLDGRLPLPRALATRRALDRALGGRELDGVLVNARFYPHSLLGMRCARERGLTPVVLDHGSDWLSLGSPGPDAAVRAYERAVTALGRRWSPAYYGISERSAEWLARLGIAAAGVIPNAIDAAAYREGASERDFRSELGVAPGAPLVAFAGRLVPEKGVRALVAASRDKRLASMGAVVALAGDGPLEGEVRAACEGGRSALRWVGRLGRADTAALLGQADLMCLPSRSEGFATTLLEAGACGCPSLVTDVGGAREVTAGGSCGRVMADAAPETVARELAGLLADRAGLAEMGERCRARVEREFGWDRTARAAERALDAAGRGDPAAGGRGERR